MAFQFFSMVEKIHPYGLIKIQDTFKKNTLFQTLNNNYFDYFKIITKNNKNRKKSHLLQKNSFQPLGG